MSGSEFIVEMKGISKAFGPVQALNKVDLILRPGEILGLVGDNAAGKSTLMKTLFGATHPDEGQIYFDGQPVHITSPRVAQSLGIGMEYQDLALFDNLDAAANIFAGREPIRRILGIPFLNFAPMYEESAQLIKRLNVNIRSPRLMVERMSGGQRQMVAAGRAVSAEAKVLIMDEPTAALGVREVKALLDLLAGFKQHGISIILVTHRIPDLFQIGDRIMVLKGGVSQGTMNVADCDLDDVVTLIVRGRPDPTAKAGQPNGANSST